MIMKHINLSTWNSDFVQAFSWTLIHSLWQGIILAILAGILLLTSRNVRPAIRYNILSGLMLCFVLANCITFFVEYGRTEEIHADTRLSGEILSGMQLNKEYLQSASTGFFKQSLQMASENACAIVAVWLFIFLFKSLKTVAGLARIYRLRTSHSAPVNEHWEKKVGELSALLKFKGEVLIRQSQQIISPIVTGIIRPMIIVPAGFFLQLPQAEIEAILLHELAHARRRDFLVNLIQNFAESVYFFNPGLLWVSYLIRQEREHCCDDLAISAVPDKKVFVNALVVFQEYRLNESAQLMAFAGKRNHLLIRIKRIINNYNKPLDAMEKLFVTASLLSGAALLAAFQKQEIPTPPLAPKVDVVAPLPPPIPPSAPAMPALVIDTVPAPSRHNHVKCDGDVSTYHITRNKKRYEITEVDEKITHLKINGKTIAENEIAGYQAELEPVMADIKQQTEEAGALRLQAEVLKLEAGHLKEQAGELKKQAELMRVSAGNAKELAYLDTDKLRQLARESQILAAQAKELSKVDTEELRLKSEELRKQSLVLKKEAEGLKINAEAERDKVREFRLESEKQRKELISDLKRDGIITDNTNLSYRLTDSSLEVNGVKQSSSHHSKYKSRYLSGDGSELVYNWKDGSGNTFTGSVIRR